MYCGHRVACRQLRHLDTPRVEEGAGADDESVGLLAPNNFEGGIDLAAGIRVEHLDLQSHGPSRRLHVSQRDLGQRSKGWVDQHGHTSCGGQQLAQEFEPLCYQFTPAPIAAIAITAPDICSRSAYRESCGSALQVACYRSPAAWCDALAASANPFSSSVFSVRASPRIKAVRDSLSFKRRSRPECRMPLHLSALRSAEFVEDIELERDVACLLAA